MTQEPEPKYLTRTVKSIRGLEARTRAAQEKAGWEFVTQSTGTIRSESTFRRPAPKTPWAVYAGLGGVVVVGAVVILLTNLIGGGGTSSEAEATPTQSGTVAPEPSRTETPTPLPTPTPPPVPQASFSAPPVDAAPEETTVDALLDKLNSADFGGSRPGDRYHLVGQAFMPELWFTGKTGDYAVMLLAQGGAQDLTILTDQTTAAAWRDGTLIDLVLEDVERTIDGETSSAWLYVVSSTVIG